MKKMTNEKKIKEGVLIAFLITLALCLMALSPENAAMFAEVIKSLSGFFLGAFGAVLATAIKL